MKVIAKMRDVPLSQRIKEECRRERIMKRAMKSQKRKVNKGGERRRLRRVKRCFWRYTRNPFYDMIRYKTRV